MQLSQQQIFTSRWILQNVVHRFSQQIIFDSHFCELFIFFYLEGVLGIPGTGFLAGISGKFGGSENSPATTYPVTVDESGKIFVELQY